MGRGPVLERHGGLIDSILALRNAPTSEALLVDPETGRFRVGENEELVAMPESERWKIHHDAVDACLDILVPAAQELYDLKKSDAHGPLCVSLEDVSRIVGYVPKKRIRR